MSCDRLFRITNPSAYYSAAQKTLVVSADVEINPTADVVHVCRNILQPLLPAATPEVVVSGYTTPGIHPQYVVIRTISGVFPMDAPPKTVAVYSMGVDAPSRTEIPVGSTPPADNTAKPAAATGTSGVTASDARAATGPVTVTGWSAAYDYDEALADAVTQLRAAVGPRNPDVGIAATVSETGVQVGGFIAKTGLYLKLQSK